VPAWPRAAPAAAPIVADIVLAADSEIVPGRVAGGAAFGGMLSQHDRDAPDIDGVLAGRRSKPWPPAAQD
jgi:hypothetical protein